MLASERAIGAGGGLLNIACHERRIMNKINLRAPVSPAGTRIFEMVIIANRQSGTMFVKAERDPSERANLTNTHTSMCQIYVNVADVNPHIHIRPNYLCNADTFFRIGRVTSFAFASSPVCRSPLVRPKSCYGQIGRSIWNIMSRCVH